MDCCGLGDVVGELPKALARRGHRVMVVAPKYGNYAEPKGVGVLKKDILKRMVFLCRAAVEFQH
ncbi:hypothetical protein C4D60_Mb01t27210 [Musa balbisiana]|uniref:Starch synthase catalytic domain-containing protein n=1 Tax=Musa balbisiana TaxID=52838 RepID=A0A4S8JR35_MUSBA|nr:hypothetical protein C4D60_Mb01t27210 [Musa balbisiana]